MSIPVSPARVAGNWLVISGQIGHTDGQLEQGGVGAQTARALEHFTAILDQYGLGTDDVVKTNVFLVDMSDFASMNDEYQKVFSHEYPARSAVAVHQLPLGADVEIEGWAYSSRPL